MAPDITNRPHFPRRAVVTGGMPYGNKSLHFGHVGGVFVPADFFARFLRDRIGAENVLFVSGTDCYGSPIMEGYRKRCEGRGYTGTITDYVRENHDLQKGARRRLWHQPGPLCRLGPGARARLSRATLRSARHAPVRAGLPAQDEHPPVL